MEIFSLKTIIIKNNNRITLAIRKHKQCSNNHQLITAEI